MGLERGLYQIRPFGICSCDSGWKCNQSRGIISLMILQLFAWRLMTFLPCLRHSTKLFTKYSEMSLIHPQVINWFWNDPYLILKVLYDLQTHKMTRKMISVFLCSSVRFNSHSLQANRHCPKEPMVVLSPAKFDRNSGLKLKGSRKFQIIFCKNHQKTKEMN